MQEVPPWPHTKSPEQAHPLENVWAAAVIVLGGLSFLLAAFPSMHVLGSWLGILGAIAGLYGQLVSVTTNERWFLVIGLGAAFVGFGLNMANGGLV